MQIRPAQPSDEASLADLFLALNRYEESISQDRRIDAEGGAAALHAAWQQVRDTGGHALIVEVDGHLAGFLFMTFR